jgi:hypothetical protein
MKLLKFHGFNLKYHKRRYGISLVVQRIEKLLLSSRFLDGILYKYWLETEERDKERFRKEVRKIIRDGLLGKELLRAVARDILGEQIRLDSHILDYLKRKVYNGDLRALLSDLQSIKEEEAALKRKEKFQR